MITKMFYYCIVSCVLFAVAFNYAQENYSGETEVNIPQLKKFHGVMYPIWHKAYPKKDVNLLRSYSEKVNNLAEDIYKVELPGILRDKKEAWEKGIEKFKSSVEDYTKYSLSNDDQLLLKTTEELHSNYENLVRIIHPVTSEINEFHKILYVIYHHYLPNNDYAKIKSVSPDFLQKAQNIKDAKLPEMFKDKTNKYNSLSADLLNAVNELTEICKSNKDDELKESIDKVHSCYQKLESLFD